MLDPKAKRWRCICSALVLFAFGIVVTGLLTAWQARRNSALADKTFNALAARTVEQLQRRLHTYEYGLRGARGAVVSAGIEHIDRARFRDYSASRDIDQEFPGARGMGLVRRVPVSDEPRFLSAARQDGKPDFAIRSLSAHAGDRYVIQYIEPIERNLPAVGLDIASEPNRRTAAESAMRTGSATLTAPITLMQAAGKPLRSFLLLLPVYAPGARHSTVEEREAATVGWSFAPLLMDEVLADFELGDDFSLTLRDDAGPETEVFFATPGYAGAAASGLRRCLPIPIYGRVWLAELTARPAFVARLNLLSPNAVGAAGLAIAALLSILSFSYAQSRQGEAQVLAEQARRAAIVDSSGDAIIGETLEGIVTDWNHGAELLFGYPALAALGQPAASLILPADRAEEDAEIRAAIARLETVLPFDTTRLRADGALVDVSVTAAPIQGPDGQRVGFSKTIRSIGAAKQAAREIAELNATLEQQVLDRTALLNASQRDLRNILDAVPSLVSYWDREFRNRFANRAYQEWLGWDPAQMPGKHLRELAQAGFENALPRFEAALRGEPTIFETTLPTLEGTVRHAVAHYLPDVVNGEVQGFYVIVYDVTAQTEARTELAAALRDNEALLGTVHEHAVVSVTDCTGRIIDVNERFCAISGYTRSELLGQDHRLINSGVHEPAFWAEVWRTIAAGKPWRGEVCNRHKDGSLYWVDSMLAPFTGADGKIEKYISIRIDITEAKQNEQKLQLTKDRIAMATDGAGIGIWEWDVVANVLTWDDWMYRLYGQPANGSEQPYTLWSSNLHPNDRERSERELQTALSGERAFDTEFRIFRPDGELRHLKASARVIRNDAGQPLRMTGVNFDITERKRAELKLLETSSLLRSVLESASEVAIIAADPRLVVSVFNPGAERLLGYRPVEVLGRATPALFHDPEEVEARAQELTVLAGEPVVGAAVFVHPLALGQPRDWTYVRKDGRRITVSLVVTGMYGKSGEVFGYLGVAHDVTRQKKYETTLRDAMRGAEQASRTKSQFLANMSHEIRTPMNAVVGLSYLLGKTALDLEQADLLSKIQVASHSLLALLNDVLDVSKIEAGELLLERAPFDLATLLADVTDLASLQARAKQIRFHTESPQGLSQALIGDVTRLTQILSNLLSNAVRFTAVGGVTLRVREEGRTETTVELRFEVQDTGIGIAPEVQPRLFAPFTQADASTTRRFGGTGLGLSIVKRLANLMGGEVGLSSELGSGSTFWVTLPFDLAPRSTVLARPRDAKRPVQDGLFGVRVLVADDSDINRFVAERVLQQEGATVVGARNGQEAVLRLKGQASSFDVVLMDLHMPVMDGYGATELIRGELGLTLPIVALTADARPSERERALAGGMNAFLAKPFEPRALIRCIQKHVVRRVVAQETNPVARRNAAEEDGWPELSGIDAADARERLYDDRALFRVLLFRLLDEFASVAAPDDLRDVQELAKYVASMHKLRGAAGQVGARTIHELAGQLEEDLVAGNAERAVVLAQTLTRELEQLRVSAYANFEPAPTALPSSDPLALEPGNLSQLLDLLREQNLGALAQVEGIYPWARKVWGEQQFEQFVRHIQNLRFADAAIIVQAYIQRAPEPPHSF